MYLLRNSPKELKKFELPTEFVTKRNPRKEQEFLAVGSHLYSFDHGIFWEDSRDKTPVLIVSILSLGFSTALLSTKATR